MDINDLLLMCFGFFLTLTMNNESVKVKNTDVLSVQMAFDWPPVFLSTITVLQKWVNTVAAPMWTKASSYVKAVYSSSLGDWR